MKRKAVVHLVHVLSGWSRMVFLGGMFDSNYFLATMGEDVATE